MYTLATAFYALKDGLRSVYDEREATAIAHEIMNHITGLSKTDRLIHKETPLEGAGLLEYENAAELLLKGVPVQYIIGEAWFMGVPFLVNEHVLIPRPETEELVKWVVDDCNQLLSGVSILDIGTGSGCIPVSIKRLLPGAEVTSCDISVDAINVAKFNAAKVNVAVTFLQLDFLDIRTHSQMGVYDVIVSNPPYIPISEKDKLHINVSQNEPQLALFVPDADPLVFYRAIAIFGKTHLKASGCIYCELDAAHAIDTKSLFENEGYKNVELRVDMHGNLRMLRAGGF